MFNKSKQKTVKCRLCNKKIVCDKSNEECIGIHCLCKDCTYLYIQAYKERIDGWFVDNWNRFERSLKCDMLKCNMISEEDKNNFRTMVVLNKLNVKQKWMIR